MCVHFYLCGMGLPLYDYVYAKHTKNIYIDREKETKKETKAEVIF